jgi:hypothetical protein
VVSELVEYLKTGEGLQIKSMDTAIKSGEFSDICKEVQDLLQDHFTVGKKRSTDVLGAPPSSKDTDEQAKKELESPASNVADAPAELDGLADRNSETPVLKEHDVTLAGRSSEGPAAHKLDVSAGRHSEVISKGQKTNSSEDLESPPLKNKANALKAGGLSKFFSSSKDKLPGVPKLPGSPSGSQKSLHNIFQSFDNKASKVKSGKQLFSGSFGEVWMGTYKSREVVTKKLFRDNGRFHAPVLKIFAEESAKISKMVHERFSY